MCFALRKTLRRGLSEVPLIFRRMRSFLRSRPTIRIAMASLTSAGLRGLARLLADLLALITNALAPVGLRRTESANLGRRLPHRLLVRTGQDDDCSLGISGNLAFDPLRKGEGDGMREAERQVEDLALELRAVAGADQLQRSRVPLGDALHHAADQGPGQSLVAGTVTTRDYRRDQHRSAVDLGRDARRKRALEGALGALDLDGAVLHRRADALGQGDGALADARLLEAFLKRSLRGHGAHQTSHSSSPPTRCLRASRSVMTPRLVLRMEIPMPEQTLSMRSWRTYTRRPGVDTRRRPSMADWRSRP